MTRPWAGAVLAVVLATLAARSARAEPCPANPAGGSGPLPAGVGPADFGAVPEACPAQELGLRLRGALLVASAAPDFYGNATAGAMLRARQPVGQRTWISLALDVVTFRYVANAVVTSTGLGFGPPTVGVYRALGQRDDLALAGYARALLPLDTARQEGREAGLELGLAARFAPGPRLGLQGGLALAAPLDVVGGQVHAALRPGFLAEAWWSPRPRVSLAAGAEGRFEAAPDPSFTSIAPRLAARVAVRGGAWLALLGEVPVAGSDRTDAVVALYAGWTALP